jgi:hypothetical protein
MFRRTMERRKRQEKEKKLPFCMDANTAPRTTETGTIYKKSLAVMYAVFMENYS